MKPHKAYNIKPYFSKTSPNGKNDLDLNRFEKIHMPLYMCIFNYNCTKLNKNSN